MALDSILVSTGGPINFSTKTEIINFDHQEGVTCKDLEEYPLPVFGAVGFNMGYLPVICGGQMRRWREGVGSTSLNECHQMKSEKWQHFAYLAQGYVLY